MATFDWTLIRTFLAVAEAGSASGAARQLLTTQPTVSRQVAALEQQLGLRLFQRHRDGLALTDRGLELLDEARAMRDAAAGLSRRAEGLQEGLTGTVRITASEVIAVEYLPAALAEVAATHPGLEFEVVASNAVVNLQRRDADLAVRMFEPTQPDLIVRRCCSLPLGAYASRAYLERHGTPRTVEALERHAFVTYDTEATHQIAARRLGMDFARLRLAFRSDSILTQIAAVRAGLGIGFLQTRLATRWPELVALDVPFPVGALACYVVTHAQVRTSHRLRTVFDALVRWFSALGDTADAERRPQAVPDPPEPRSGR